MWHHKISLGSHKVIQWASASIMSSLALVWSSWRGGKGQERWLATVDLLRTTRGKLIHPFKPPLTFYFFSRRLFKFQHLPFRRSLFYRFLDIPQPVATWPLILPRVNWPLVSFASTNFASTNFAFTLLTLIAKAYAREPFTSHSISHATLPPSTHITFKLHPKFSFHLATGQPPHPLKTKSCPA